jgi:3,4-dihydroxy 2-butanone 4-phosphate synthase / GTP cyclohydrolase II
LNSIATTAGTTWAAAAERAFRELTHGQVVVFERDTTGEDLAAFVVDAALVSPEHLQLMVQFGGDMLWVALEQRRADALRLRGITSERADDQPSTLVPIDLRGTSGQSLSDRAATIRALASPQSTAADFMRPGHILPVVVEPSRAVLGHPNIPEAALELLHLSGREPVAAGCMLMNRAGKPAGKVEIRNVVRRRRLSAVRTSEIALYAMERDAYIDPGAKTILPLPDQSFKIQGFRSRLDGRICVVLVRGEAAGRQALPVYLHRHSTVGDVFHSSACDCRSHLDRALKELKAAPAGVLIYLISESIESLGLTHARECQQPWTPYETAIAAHALRSLEARSLVLATPELVDVELLSAFTQIEATSSTSLRR